MSRTVRAIPHFAKAVGEYSFQAYLLRRKRSVERSAIVNGHDSHCHTSCRVPYIDHQGNVKLGGDTCKLLNNSCKSLKKMQMRRVRRARSTVIRNALMEHADAVVADQIELKEMLDDEAEWYKSNLDLFEVDDNDDDIDEDSLNEPDPWDENENFWDNYNSDF